jgi:signal transduction histidine kinase
VIGEILPAGVSSAEAFADPADAPQWPACGVVSRTGFPGVAPVDTGGRRNHDESMNKSAGSASDRPVRRHSGFLPAGWLPAGRAEDRFRRELFSRPARDGLLYAIAGLPLSLIGFGFTVATLGIGAYTSLIFIGLPLIGGSTLGARRFGVIHRRLARRLLAVRIPEPPPFRPGRGLVGWTRAALMDAVGWRARAYLLLKLPVGAAGGIAALMWAIGAYYLTYPLWWEVFHRFTYHPSWSTRRVPVLAGPLPFGRFEILTLPGTLLIPSIGLAVVLAAPWATSAVNAMDVSLIRRLLGAATLSERVRELERTRALAVDDSVARLRSIERDLHDGTQARLVAVTMKLGLAKEKLLGEDTAAGQPDLNRALELVDTAQSTAQEAMDELRGLVRGIHPPVLNTGLGAALTSLTARSEIPVELIVDVPDRPSPTVETIAYFCAAELLANVAKHSRARHAAVEAVHIPGLLRLRVTDDGVGGVRLDAVGGLQGLADRLRTVDGEMEISSPRGGPTVITVELPSDA